MFIKLKNQNKYTIILIGFLIGLIIAALGLITTAISIENIKLNFIGVLHLHVYFPFLWVTDSLIIIFPTLAYYINKLFNNVTQGYQVKLSTTRRSRTEIFEFVEKLREGHVDAQFAKSVSENEIADSLVKLQDEIKRSQNEEEKRNKEDEERRWITEGLALFGEHLRSTTNLSELSYLLISKLVDYIDVDQGGFFVLRIEKDEKIFEQTGSYAYDRKKFCDQTIEWGEGLLGACAIEQKPLYLPEVTEGYVNITSGLGKTNPKVLFILPLIRDFEIHGMMEFSSLEEIPEFKRDFLVKLAESIAITLSNTKTEAIKAKLLEDSRKQAEVLAQQEENLRSNMERLNQIQKEKESQAEEFVSFTNSVNHTLIRAEYSPEGNLLYANTNFIFKLEYFSNSEVEGKPIYQFINPKDRASFGETWEELSTGGTHLEGSMKLMTKSGKDLWTMATYTCVRRADDSIERVLFLAIDITEQKVESIYHAGISNAIDNSSIKAEFDLAGNFILANNKFLLAMEIQKNKITDYTIYDVLASNNYEEFKEAWNKVINGKNYENNLKLRSIDGKDIRWMRTTLSPVANIYNEISAVVFIAHDITMQVEADKKLMEQTAKLEEQEIKLKAAQVKLTTALDDARVEIKSQFIEIEDIKILNEKTLDGALDAIITIDIKEKVLFFNKAAEKLFQRSAQDVTNKSLELIFPKNKKDENHISNLFHASSNFLGKRQEVNFIDNDGNKISVLLTLSEGKYHRKYTLTAFIQTIEVELF
ncbi:MAG: PAS domain-containing protein [Bacteroidales bacterium]|nr:PAS domain-containing protein [Bacteroidales bacterium]